MAKREAGKSKDVQVTVVQQPGGVYRAYSNHINVSWTSNDVRLEFNDLTRQSVMVPSESDVPTNRIEQLASIALAWSQAKVLHSMLGDMLHRFEEINGEINVPEIKS